ncbi:MAG TPA: 50S ribosomal protein L10 [Acidimicrobiales bacterium]|nr:50S ribosomal protein L10 [Acidimicrobiales bacterium]
MDMLEEEAMENPRAEKVALVDEVRTRLSSSSAAILTEYRGLKVSELAGLRRALRQAGGEYKIYKNTLVRFAVRDLDLEALEPLVEGPTAIAFVDGDAASVAKALRDFARTNPHLVVKGGLLGQNVLSAADAGALADLPSRDRMLAQIAGALAAPLQQFASLLQAAPQNLAYGLRALIDEKGGVPEAAEEAAPSAPPSSDEMGAADAAAPSDPASEAEASSAAGGAASEAEEGAPEASAQEESAATQSSSPSDPDQENAPQETPESAG